MLQHRSTNFNLDYCENFLLQTDADALFNQLLTIMPKQIDENHGFMAIIIKYKMGNIVRKL